MKLLQYLFLGIAKIIGPLWFLLVAMHWRHEARNAVANHVLNNNLGHRLKRLWERNPENMGTYWMLTPLNPWENQKIGIVWMEDYSKLKFWLLFWLVWIWCDDDSTCDTYDCGHAGYDDLGFKYFNQGDEYLHRFKLYPALRWQMRNTSMNFKYYFMDY